VEAAGVATQGVPVAPVPLHPTAPTLSAIRSSSRLLTAPRNLRLGSVKNSRPASKAPPVRHGGLPESPCAVVQLVEELDEELDEFAVVTMVSVATPGVFPLTLTVLVALKLTAGGLMAPLGLVVTAAVSVTVPVKPLIPVTEMLPVPLLPRATVILPPGADRLKPGVSVDGGTTVS
jgi:hypothetical protein